MKSSKSPAPDQPTAAGPEVPFRDGDTLIDRAGKRYVIATGVTDDDEADGYLILESEHREPLARGQISRYLTFDEFESEGWTHIPAKRKEVRRMAKTSITVPALPKMTKADWLKRERTRVLLTRGELDQLARLVTAGRALLRNEPSISPSLRAAMTRLGMDTKGL